MFARQILSLWRDSEGSALVEASVLTPVLFIIFFGVFEFSWFFFNQQLVESGVRDAARYLARGPTLVGESFQPENSNPCNNATNVTRAKNLAVTGTIDGSGSARVKGWNVGSVTIICPSTPNSSGTYAGGDPIYDVNVSTTFADPALGLLFFLGLGTPNISASHSERSLGSG